MSIIYWVVVSRASICKILTEIIINVLQKFIDFLDFSIRLCVGYINAGWNLLQLVESSTFNVSDLYASVSILVIIEYHCSRLYFFCAKSLNIFSFLIKC